MASMSYCKFENTLADLRQCLEALRDGEEIGSEYEQRAFKNMFEEMVDFLMEEEIIGHENDDHEPVWDVLDAWIDDKLNGGDDDDE